MHEAMLGARPERCSTQVSRSARISTSSLTTRATQGTQGACTGTSQARGMRGRPGPTPDPLRAGEEDPSRRRTSLTMTWGRAAAAIRVGQVVVEVTPEVVVREEGAGVEHGDKEGIEGAVEEEVAPLAEAATATIDDHQEDPDNVELVSVDPVASVVLVLPVFLPDRNRNRRPRPRARALVRTDSRVDRSNTLSISSSIRIKIWEGMTLPTPFLSILINRTHLNSRAPACNLDNLNLVIRPTPLKRPRVRCNGTVKDIPQPPRDVDNGPLLPPASPMVKATSASSNSSNTHLCPQLCTKARSVQCPTPRLSTPDSRRSISRCSRAGMPGRGSRDRGTTTRNDVAARSG